MDCKERWLWVLDLGLVRGVVVAVHAWNCIYDHEDTYMRNDGVTWGSCGKQSDFSQQAYGRSTN